jgi:hypothetical protein
MSAAQHHPPRARAPRQLFDSRPSLIEAPTRRRSQPGKPLTVTQNGATALSDAVFTRKIPDRMAVQQVVAQGEELQEVHANGHRMSNNRYERCLRVLAVPHCDLAQLPTADSVAGC